MANANDQMMYQTMVQINSSLVQILKLLQEMKRNGVPVITQESHRP